MSAPARHSRIAGTGSFLPPNRVSNAELAARLARDGIETSDEWIVERTGIRFRHFAEPHVTSSDLGVEAAKRALAAADCDPQSLDLIIVATSTPDMVFPSAACMVQEKLGIHGCAAFDVQAVCSGFVYALSVADSMIKAGLASKALVVGAEVFSRILDWKDRGTCVLFGDGAGALVLEAAEFGGPLGFVLHSDGSKKAALFAEGPCGPRDADGNGPAPHLCTINMDGPAIFKFAVNAMTNAVREALAKSHLGVDDVDVLVPHQANLRIIQGTAKALGIAPEKALITVDKYGNTSSASIPVALSEAQREGRLPEGARLALCAFGGGLAWGSLILEWSTTGVRPEPAAPVATPARA